MPHNKIKMNTLLSVFLLTQPEGQEGGLPSWVFLIAIFGVFYMFMIRPQQKKAKEAKQFRESIGKGTKVVTIGGIHGKVESVKEKTVIITTEGGGKLKIEKSALSVDNSVNEMAVTQGK